MTTWPELLHATGFVILGGFQPLDAKPAAHVVLIASAGPRMYQRFSRERDPQTATLDQWTKDKLQPLADTAGAQVVFPFDDPPPPFITWAKAAGLGHQSPLGLLIHPDYGLWFGFRAAFLFESEQAFVPNCSQTDSPCDSCRDKPCLSACPVGAFEPGRYHVETCRTHLRKPEGQACYYGGCLARRACPIGQAYIYETPQHEFHMRKFIGG